jgi:membrane-associated protease RseP (regulator of RpoE activity)
MLILGVSLAPMLLLTLVIHELGHLALARIRGAGTSSFQVGVGWRIITWHTGRTFIRLTRETALLNPQAGELKPGNLASVYAARGPGEEVYSAAGVLPMNGTSLPLEQWETVRRHNETHMRLNGRVREIDEGRIILADMSWSLKAIPLAAQVTCPDDPSRSMPEAYNAMPWRWQAAITLAGVTANIALALAALLTVAVFLPATVDGPAWTVVEVEPGGPAAQAGILPGDCIVSIGDLAHPGMAPPGMKEIYREVMKAARRGGTLRTGVLRNGSRISLQVRPEPETGRIGALLELWETPGRERRMTPQAIALRIWNTGETYTRTLQAMALILVGEPEGRTGTVFRPVTGYGQTGQAAGYAVLRTWLIILATLNLGTAATNLLPIPSMDGYKMVAEAVLALRKGKPVNPALERAMVAGGIMLMFLAPLYLLVKDMIERLG